MPRGRILHRLTEVRSALAGVSDPELDQSIVDLGFITRIAVDGDRVAVDFRLPTFWCSANFAWIMAEDMRAALAALGWVRHADIRLVDHFAAEKINAGIANGSGFQGAFGGEAGGDLTALRETFRRKAYLGRMSALIEALRAAGWAEEMVTSARIADLAALNDASTLEKLAARFLEMRGALDGPLDASSPAFRDADGNAVPPGRLAAFLRDIRMTRRSVEANGEMCRILHKERAAPNGRF